MRHLLVATLLYSVSVLYAFPTGRYLGSDPNSPTHSHASDDIFVDDYLQSLWDAAPSTSYHSPPRIAAPDDAHAGQPGSSPPPQMPVRDHSHEGHSAPNALEPASKRLKKQHTLHPPPQHQTDAQVVSKSDALSGSSWTPSRHTLGSQKYVLASSHTAFPASAPQRSTKPRATRKKQQPAEQWKKAGLPMTEEAKPHDVHASLFMIHSNFKNNKETSLRSSVITAAMASVAHGCTSKPQYIACMKRKYGEDLLRLHSKSLGRIINKDMKEKGTYGLGTRIRRVDKPPQPADDNRNSFLEDKRSHRMQAKLKLPPVDRIEPPIESGDVHNYLQRIDHLDPYGLRLDDFLKQGYHPLEQEPHKWNKSIPRMAMILHLGNNNANDAMLIQFKKHQKKKFNSVSTVLGGCLPPEVIDTGKQARRRQLRHKTRGKSSKSLAASPSHSSPH